MKALINHPGMWLADDAADSLTRWEARYGVLPLSDAGRTDTEQAELVHRWAIGGPENRPPYLYEPAVVSPHQSGTALDTPDHDRFGETCGEYGWRFNITSDPVHAIYEGSRDQHRGETAPGTNTEGEDTVLEFMAEMPIQPPGYPNPGSMTTDGSKHTFYVVPSRHVFWHVKNNGQLKFYQNVGVRFIADQGADIMLNFRLLKDGESA